MERGQFSFRMDGEGGLISMRPPGSKLVWCIEPGTVSIKRRLFSAVYATCNANVSVELGGEGLYDFVDGKTVQLTTLADSARIVGSGHMGVGAYVAHEEHPDVTFVWCAGLTDRFTEIRFVNGGKAVRDSARRNQGIPTMYNYMGVEFPYAGRETEVGVCWNTKGIGQSWTEFEASHKLSDSWCMKLQVTPDKNTLSCHFTI